MRLSAFILENMDAIVAEWEAFASTLLPAAEHMTALALRDHAQQILATIAADLETPQTREQQSAKCKGHASPVPGSDDTAAQTHAVLRAKSGFDVVQLVAEYRALRASVLRLWLDARHLDAHTTPDMIRFNEAIDQAVAESVEQFHNKVEQARNLFLGMLGHDLRAPLTAISMTAERLGTLHPDGQTGSLSRRIARSAAAMQALLDDLTDFIRTLLGLGLVMKPTEIDFAAYLHEEIDLLREAYPNRAIHVAVDGEVRGRWDGARLRQVVRNLATNALKYGDADSPVRISLAATADGLRLEVRNRIERGHADVREHWLQPLTRGIATPAADDENHHLGLGLFIVGVIVLAHGGTLDVRPHDAETTFVVDLPRQHAARSEAEHRP